MRAVVLQSFAYSESSRIVRLITPDVGLASAIARGARRPRSRFSGVLEPFTEGDAHLLWKEGRDLQTLSEWELVRSRQQLGRSLVAFAGASLLAELVLRFGSTEPSAALFERLCTSLNAVAAEAERPEAVSPLVIGAAWLLVGLLGFAPQTEECVCCARALAADEPARFDAPAGGAVCVGCRPAGRILPPDARRTLGRLVGGVEHALGPDQELTIHLLLLQTFLQGQLGSERPLRSLDLFMQGSRGG
jgi:DNA repair protein RecO (recombination protein O)